MEPEILTVSARILAGKKMKTSFSNNNIANLWADFMPTKHLLMSKNENLFSVEVYPGLDFFRGFDPTKTFEKWACVEVKSLENLGKDFDYLKIPEDLYAKFIYRGKASLAAAYYTEIFKEWLPSSEFILDNRPHFAVMGKKYKGEDVTSEEEIFIPIRRKL